MKRMITKFALVTIVVLFSNSFKSLAQATIGSEVTPGTTAGINYFCSSGGDLDFGTPADGTWVVRYSPTATTTPGTGITLTGNKVLSAQLQTGFYYLINVGSGAGACESEMQEIPVYKLLPINATFTAADYCIENASTTTFNGPTSTGDVKVPTFAYQWYTVSGGTETAITGATNATYTPPNTILPGTAITYRLKVGYSIGSLKYCSTTSADQSITVTPKPAKPAITISGATTGSSTF